MADSSPERPVREPLLNAPALVLVIPAIILAGYGLQVLAGPQANNALIDAYALSPVLLRQGHYDLLLSHMFLHGSWMHALMNAAFCFAFSAPVVRAAGRGPGGVLSFFLFYLVCGVVAGFGYCLLNWRADVAIIGASGAISGIMGAAIRLGVTPGRFESFRSSRVITMTVFWCGVNAASAFVPGVTGPAGVLVAWQAHVVGYLAGLLLIEPWIRLFHRRYFTTS
ncbi:MAG: rhomboid family intramembrane serine protease [Asticcacaulis sp.]